MLLYGGNFLGWKYVWVEMSSGGNIREWKYLLRWFLADVMFSVGLL